MSLQITNSLQNVNGYGTIEQTYLTPKDEKSTSNVVFDKIKEMASDTLSWKNLLVRTNEKVDLKEASDKLMTACGINANLLNMFFVGEAQAKRVLECLSFTTSESVPFCGPYSKGYLWDTLHFHNFLSGNAVLDLNKYLADPSFSMAKPRNWAVNSPEYTKARDLFKQHVANLYLKDVVDDKIYDYNNNVIDSLEKEVNRNRDKVSEDCSFIYHVAIIEPPTSLSFKGSLQSVLNGSLGYLHVFNLEQHYDHEKKSDSIRLHQAWKDKFSLADNYGDGFKDSIEISLFCRNFKEMLGYDNPPEFKKIQRCKDACFNVNEKGTPAGVFRNDINLYTGGSVRYATSEINPKDCLKHIDDILKKYG